MVFGFPRVLGTIGHCNSTISTNCNVKFRIQILVNSRLELKDSIRIKNTCSWFYKSINFCPCLGVYFTTSPYLSRIHYAIFARITFIVRVTHMVSIGVAFVPTESIKSGILFRNSIKSKLE